VNIIFKINYVVIQDAVLNVLPNIQYYMIKCVVYTIKIDTLCISRSVLKKIVCKVN
jgi:hypothetical protein